MFNPKYCYPLDPSPDQKKQMANGKNPQFDKKDLVAEIIENIDPMDPADISHITCF
jgi:hypothetical protein